jgi:hypothetical protein
LRFSYQPFDVDPTPAMPDASVVYRPVIPVTFSGRARSPVIWSLLDTGADESYITEEMADFLGVERMGDETFAVESASGEMPVRYGDCDLEIQQGSESFRWRISIGIVPQIWSEAILGHAGFLHFFDATYSFADKSIELRLRTPFANPVLRQ